MHHVVSSPSFLPHLGSCNALVNTCMDSASIGEPGALGSDYAIAVELGRHTLCSCDGLPCAWCGAVLQHGKSLVALACLLAAHNTAPRYKRGRLGKLRSAWDREPMRCCNAMICPSYLNQPTHKLLSQPPYLSLDLSSLPYHNSHFHCAHMYSWLRDSHKVHTVSCLRRRDTCRLRIRAHLLRPTTSFRILTSRFSLVKVHYSLTRSLT